MSDLGARFVACRRWRWMPGMLVADHGEGVRVSGVCAEFIHGSAAETPVNRHGPVWMRLRLDVAHVPVVDDPATLGCILALVREAWPNAWVERFFADEEAGLSDVWMVFHRFEPRKMRSVARSGRSEAEALLLALECAS